MKTKWICRILPSTIIVLSILAGVGLAGRAWKQWRPGAYIGVSTPNPIAKDYEQLIGELEQGIKDLESERATLQEKTTFVSVAALRATADEVFEPFFSKWIAKAQEWDENAQSNNPPGDVRQGTACAGSRQMLDNFFDIATEPCPEPRKDKLIEAKSPGDGGLAPPGGGKATR